jgi:formamidopyrimidine-DNA glycosylase
LPELPEVETIVRGLRKQIVGLELLRAEIRLSKCVRGEETSFCASLRGKKILSLGRRGKNILFHLSGGAALVVHLRMTGRLQVFPRQTPLDKHTHAVFSFRGRPDQLRFHDTRQFGRIYLEKKSDKGTLPSLGGLGPEPLEISLREFIRRVRARKRMIKPMLLDQAFLAGIGNIYADEGLHRARVHPRRGSSSLADLELSRLYRALRKILREAIRLGGTSVRSYVDSRGARGKYQDFLRVYHREGEKCRTCGAAIVREQIGGRIKIKIDGFVKTPSIQLGAGLRCNFASPLSFCAPCM